VADRLVIGENVAQATQFALSGGAQAGLVAYAMLLSPDLAGRAAFALVPEDWHRPLRQRMVVMRGARPGATAFFDYLRSDAARSVLARYGFTEPQ
jgi:molybdate transport system substrate-binding protein